ncbi:interactor of constitutive active ROPs 1-like isoform X2 [Canna indica]|uniref:Interactor of constitutive active ROPs 1-like isoform X2 n=1 Tax=Canna indica TaxID=4628 RepID=A0AAQ3QMA9_9LILI|nr:interactor of constitutive active ROPs 1-like isoform X2 [Canna indica]
MPRPRGIDFHQQQSPRNPLHLKNSTGSEANSLHRAAVDNRSPKLDDGRSPRSPPFERKRGSRAADLETKLNKAQEELGKLRDQLASAEVAKVDAEEALEKAKKQVFTANRIPEVNKEAIALLPKSDQTRSSKLENVISPATADASEVMDPTETIEVQNDLKQGEEEKGNVDEDPETMFKEDCYNDIGAMEEKLQEKSPEVLELKAMILEKEKEVEVLLEENMVFKRRAEAEAAELSAAARAKEEELLAKISSMDDELKQSRERTACLTEKLAAAEAAKAKLEEEMRRLRIQTEQWRKAAEAATALLATGDTKFRELGGGRRVTERCRSMDKHIGGGYFGWDSPSELEEDKVGGGRRRATGVRMFGDLWRKKMQHK